MNKKSIALFKDKGSQLQFDGIGNFLRKGRAFKLEGRGLYLYTFMDGNMTDERLLRNVNKKFPGRSVSADDFKGFVRRLRSYNLLLGRINGCLVGKDSSMYIEWMMQEIERSHVRKAMYAGICYEDDPQRLAKDLQKYFNAVDPVRLRNFCGGYKGIRGIVVPHSNMDLSGACAAWAYKAVALYPLPDTCIILGPRHRKTMPTPSYCTLLKDFSTPLGRVRVDADLGRALAAECPFDMFGNNSVHIGEHSIELQLPFLQHIYRRNKKKLRIIPIVCKTEYVPSEKRAFVQALKKVCARSGKRVLIIASADLIHSDAADFHVTNRKVLRSLQIGNAAGCMRRIDPYPMCGKIAIPTLLEILAPTRGKVLNYLWSRKSMALDPVRMKRKYGDPENIGHASVVYA